MLGYLGAALGIGSDLLNRQFRRKEEKGRRKYERTQELDRRTYDQAMWAKVNKYNHPLAQMQRLTDAGLNPNLIYGSSPGSAVGNAQSIASGKQLQAEAPQYQMGNPMTPFMDTRIKQAQSNNLDSLSTLNDTKNLTEIENNRKTRAEADVAAGTVGANIEIAQIKAKIQYEKLLQEELNTLALSDKDNGVIARYALGTMQARIEKDSAMFKQNVDALRSYMASKGIDPNSYEWLKIMAMIPGFSGKLNIPEFHHEGLDEYQQKKVNLELKKERKNRQ